MLVGPVFGREVVTVPRRARLYVARTAYVAALLVLISTAWLVLTGTQQVRHVGDFARFGSALFQLLAPLQLALAVIFSALLAASAVAQEKDRRTLILLLLTRLSNHELVLGKLLASLLMVLVMLAAALPVFMIAALFGGISYGQIARAFGVTLASGLVAGSLGSTIALWGQKTFQALALTALALVGWVASWEVVASGGLGAAWAGIPADTWAASFSPVRAILSATRTTVQPEPGLGALGSPVYVFLCVAAALAVVLNGVAIWRVRIWNPSREVRRQQAPADATIWGAEHDLQRAADTKTEGEEERSVHAAPGKTRRVWNNPVLWREICTWAYGRKVQVIRLSYILMIVAAFFVLRSIIASYDPAGAATIIPPIAQPLAPVLVVSLLLINALAVTSLTSERDGRALDVLLTTDLSAREIIFGKLGGVFYITREMVLAPMLLCIYVWYEGQSLAGNPFLSLESLIYLLISLLVLATFAAMLGIHSAMTYSNSRSAIGVSLGTILFLVIGIATCLRMMIAFSGSFQFQLAPFLAFMVGGTIGLFSALGVRNPSSAILLASLIAPTATFYALTSFLLQKPAPVFFATVLTYGFATAAMLVPALYEFDIATGRTTGGEE